MSRLFCALLVGIGVPAALSRAAGSDPSGEKKRLDRMKFPEIVAALGAREGRHIADLGAGEGPFTIALARVAGPRGRVYAVDINDDVLERLRKRVAGSSLGNVEVIRGDDDNPKLPEG